jgi:hypothetical protein
MMKSVKSATSQTGSAAGPSIGILLILLISQDESCKRVQVCKDTLIFAQPFCGARIELNTILLSSSIIGWAVECYLRCEYQSIHLKRVMIGTIAATPHHSQKDFSAQTQLPVSTAV